MDINNCGSCDKLYISLIFSLYFVIQCSIRWHFYSLIHRKLEAPYHSSYADRNIQSVP